MHARGTSERLDALDRCEESLGSRREDVVERLGRLVQTPDKSLRRRVLRLKRDVFNGRSPREKDLQTITRIVGEEDGRTVAAYVDASLQAERLRQEYLQAYERDRERARRGLWRVVADPVFENGLLLASSTLHTRLASMRKGSLADGVTGRQSGRARKLERALLKYVSRFAMKATPFGTFCSVVEGRFVEALGAGSGTGPLLRVEGDLSSTTSVIRLNKKLHSRLLRRLKARPVVRRNLRVALNATLRDGEGTFEFLSDIGDGEMFQRVDRSPVLDLIRSLLPQGREICLSGLVEEVLAQPGIDAPEADVEAFLFRLLEIGFLRYRLGIGDQDADWDRPMEALCRLINDEQALSVADFLRELRGQVELYAPADPDGRARILAESRRLLKDVSAALGIRKDTSRSTLFYEDVTADARLLVEAPRVGPALQDLLEFASLTTRVAIGSSERATMRHFFERTQAAGASVPLLEFFEEFHRGHLKAHREHELAMKTGRPSVDREYDVSNPFRLPFVEAVQSARRRLTDLIAERWACEPDAEEIRISAAEVAAVFSDVPAVSDRICRSIGAFVELVPHNSAETGCSVLLHRGGLVPGFGKYASRFLYLLPQRVREGVRGRNRWLSLSRLAEIEGDGDFNANIHVALLPWGIAYPTGEGGGGSDSLDTADLRVEADPDDHQALRLIHAPSGERVIPVNLGFQVGSARPALYQFLSQLAPPVRFVLGVPQRPSVSLDGRAMGDASEAVGSDEIVHRPRVVFGRHLILARRAWIVPKALFPTIEQNEPEADYFRRVRRWRERHGLPKECYIRLSVGRAGPAPSINGPLAPDRPDDGGAAEGQVDASVDSSDGSEGTASDNVAADRPDADGEEALLHTASPHDSFKPQYVDFDSPLLVDLFARVPGALGDFTLVVEERLPGSPTLPQGPLGRHAVEMLVQMDFPETPSGQCPPGEGS